MRRQQSVQLTARIQPELKDELERIAWERKSSVGAVFRELLCGSLGIELRLLTRGRPAGRRLESDIR